MLLWTLYEFGEGPLEILLWVIVGLVKNPFDLDKLSCFWISARF